MSLNSKKRSLNIDPKRNTGFVVVKKRTLGLEKQTTQSSLEKEYQLLQENLKSTQSQLEKITQEKDTLEDKCKALYDTKQILQKNNMKLESLNKACLTLLFQSCQHEEQLTQVRSLIEKSTNTNYENYLKYNMNQSPETQQSEVIKALDVIEKY